MRGLALAALATGASAQANLVFQQSQTYAVYTSAALSRHNTSSGSDLVTGAFATWLNPPLEAEVYNVTSANGEMIWQYSPAEPQGSLITYQVVSSRHVIGDPFSDGLVDTFVAQAGFVPPSNCSVFGFITSGPQASGTPSWTFNVDQCDSSLLYDDYVVLDASDEGSLVLFTAVANNSQGVLTSRVYGLNGQNGNLIWSWDLGPSVPATIGEVSVSQNGAYAVYTVGTTAYAIEGKTGVSRANVTLPVGSVAGAISDDGNTLGYATLDNAYIATWNGNTYNQVRSLVPTGTTQWYPMDLQIHTGSVLVGFVSGDVLTARVIAWNVNSSSVVMDYTSPTNTKLQTNPTVRLDGAYAGLGMWGDQGEATVPTALLFSLKTGALVFNYTTPGSVFGVDVVVGSSTPSADTVYLAVSGKHTPANEFGNGGDAYVWAINVPTA